MLGRGTGCVLSHTLTSTREEDAVRIVSWRAQIGRKCKVCSRTSGWRSAQRQK